MAKKWAEVVANPEYQALPPEQQEEARLQYFSEVVQPLVPKSKWDEVRAEFDADTAPKSPQPQAAKPEKRSFLDDVVRQAGLTVRHGIAGVAALPAMAADAVTGVVNTGLDAVAGEGNGPRFMPAGQALQRVMTAAGLPEPANSQERVVGDIASAMAGAGGMVKAGQVLANAATPVTQAVGAKLAEGAGMQVSSAAAGAGASGLTREGGGGTGAQVAAGVLGALAPGAVPMAGQAAWRGVARGGEAGRQRVAENLAKFEQAGTTPTLGQATESRVWRGVESALAKAPGGAGVIARNAQKQADDMAGAVQKLSDELAPDASAINAGEAISRGINAFKDGIKKVQQRLYDDLDQHIPQDAAIAVNRTQEALKALNADIPGAPHLSEFFKNAKIKGIDRALQDDLAQAAAMLEGQGGALPYEAIKKLRTMVGREISDNSLMSDVPRSKWTALYGALSDDLGDAAKAAGPKAEASWNWANSYTKSQLGRLEQLSSIVSRDSPEKIFTAAIAGTVEGDTVVRRVISALPRAERREVAAAVLQRLGRATPGQQNAMGDAFSSETFLSNLSKLSLAARKTLFGRTDVDGIADRVSVLANLAESRRDGGRVFANPSGTAGAEAQLAVASGLGAGMATSALTGNPLPLAAAVSVPAISNAAARRVTDPNLIRKLASPTPIPMGIEGAAVGAFGRTDFDQGVEQLPPTDAAQQQPAPDLGPQSSWLGDPAAPMLAQAMPPPKTRSEQIADERARLEQMRASAMASIGTATTVDEAIAAATAAINVPTKGAIESSPVPPPAPPEPIATTAGFPMPQMQEPAPYQMAQAPAPDWRNDERLIPVSQREATRVDMAALDAAADPSDPQRAARNFKHGHTLLAGMDISIANASGSTRRGTDEQGMPWSQPVTAHVGKVRGTAGKGGAPVTALVAPGTPEDFRGPFFVIDQTKADGRFDESKVVVGARTAEEASELYAQQYPEDWDRLGAVTQLPYSAFHAWLRHGSKKKPLGDIEGGADTQGGPEAAEPMFAATRQPSGELVVRGDPDAIVQRLADAGVSNFLRLSSGVVVGRSSAESAEGLFAA